MTPVTLELGGKSPAIVDADAPLAATARRLLAGKFMNAGQVCIAPDYVLVVGGAPRVAALVAELRAGLREFYGEDPKASRDLGRIVNRRHFDRVAAALKSCRGDVVIGGKVDADDLYVGASTSLPRVCCVHVLPRAKRQPRSYHHCSKPARALPRPSAVLQNPLSWWVRRWTPTS